ncbi:hypothetical protein [Amycolatopsis benzoatilytica]|uniref:hypothetical protein n=1 Tax=Amycolatopsis benzoatilytica TaxID=346045 RepID=UPI000360BCEA|nr:hypothetical protein [Amycolatopsis benzoatilytica]
MSFLENLDDAGHWVGGRIDDVTGFSGKADRVSSLFQPSTADEAIPAHDLVRKVRTGPGSQSWHDSANAAKALADLHHDAGDVIFRVSAGLESAWTGSGADAAQARIRALAETAAASGAVYAANSDNLTDVAHGFDALKASLQQLPDQPPHLAFCDQAAPWDIDTEQEISQYNATAQQNVDHYQAYVQHAGSNRQQLQADYGELDNLGPDPARKSGPGERPLAQPAGHPPTPGPGGPSPAVDG